MEFVGTDDQPFRAVPDWVTRDRLRKDICCELPEREMKVQFAIFRRH